MAGCHGNYTNNPPVACDVSIVSDGSLLVLTASIVHHAKHHPAVQIESLEVEPCGDSVYRVRATVANRGLLPSFVTNKGRSLGRFAPVMASLRPAPGVELISQKGHLDLGHLQGVSGTAVGEWFVKAAGVTELGSLSVRGAAGGDSTVSVTV